MALSTLKGKLKTPSGDSITHSDELSKIVCKDHIIISSGDLESANAIAFRIQNGPIKEVGVNGCQVTALIEVAQMMLEGLNESFPCDENEMTITKLKEALMWQDQRTKERERRGVEGFDRV